MMNAYYRLGTFLAGGLGIEDDPVRNGEQDVPGLDVLTAASK
jgi:hypothetical protein